jgi:zeta-carotene desaturase
MPHVLVLGGGLAGLSSALALGQAGHHVTLLESRAFPGGRACSYPLPSDPTETIDNCQHILLKCCVNLIDFYQRLGVFHHVRFHNEFYFIEPGGRVSLFRRGALPAPLHFSEAFASLSFLNLREKFAVARALLALPRQRLTRLDLDRITMADWLREQRQPPRAITRFWRQILVSAINEELDRMAASHAFQVLWLGFLAAPDTYEMGVPGMPLSKLYAASPASVLFRHAVSRIVFEHGRVARVETGHGPFAADHFISALPFHVLPTVAPELTLDFSAFSYSPITGIHLFFDRPVTTLPHATLLDRTIHWMYNKSDGRHLSLVVSASRSLLPLSRQQIIDLAVAELAEFFPAVRQARLDKAHVVKEARATFSACPGLEEQRPIQHTAIPNFSLAGDWTRTGWPATMEGAVRSGYLAAEHASAALGSPQRFLFPDIA